MMKRVACIASALCEAQVLEGSCIAVFQEPGVDWICSMLAIMRVGATYIPLDLTYGLPRLSAIMNESLPSIILTDSRIVDQVVGFQSAAITINIDLIHQGPPPTKVPNRSMASAPAAILFTSGSTGTPKGIKLSHTALQNHVEGCILEWGVSGETVLQQSPYGFDFSLFGIYLGLLTGGTVYVVPREMRGDASAITNIIAAEEITVACGVPSELMTWLQYGDRELLKSSRCKMMVSGGERFGMSFVQRLRELNKLDLRVMNIYGPTEATISATFSEVEYRGNLGLLEWGVPVGRALPNYAVYILDEDLNPVPQGVPGQIAIAGSISSGYLGNDDFQRQKFVPDPFASPEWKAKEWRSMYLSGDRGRLRSSDGALIFEGRIEDDTQVKLRGFRIEMEDVESNILAAGNGSILQAVCSARGDPPEYLVGHVTFSPGHRPPSRHEQDGFLAQLVQNLSLPRYMRPAVIVPLEAMPFTVSGKLDRRAVGGLPLPLDHVKTQPERQLNQTETSLRELWLSVLRKNEVSLASGIDADSDFFHVGGNSLLLISLAAKIKETFGTKLPIIQLFETSSLAAMAAKVDSICGTKTHARDVDAQDAIDWDEETSLDGIDHNHLIPTLVSRECTTPHSGRVCVLTGATGFLGRHILSSLLADPSVGRVYCIAVRNPDALIAPLDDKRVQVYPGTLGEPRLGLTPVEAQNIFQHADAIIHNGADVSFLKTYASLRASNVGSTKELVRMMLSYRCSNCPSLSIPAFHYVSTVGVAQLQEGLSEGFRPAPAMPTPLHRDGSKGYPTTKWVSERFLERLVASQGRPKTLGEKNGPLRVVIHRPSSITGLGAPRSMDIVQNLLHYCRQLRAVPQDLGDIW